MSSSPAFVVTPKFNPVQILPADALTLKTVYTAAANGSKITGVILSSTDTAAKDVVLYVSKGGVDYPLGAVTVPITAGTIVATPSVNGLNTTSLPGLPVDSDGQRYILLDTGCVLKAAVLVAVTAAKVVNVMAIGGDL